MRDLDKDVYQVISKLGLEEKEIDELFEKNKFLSKVMGRDVLQVIHFFEKYGLTREEIGKIAIKNPWLLTESFERVRYIEEYLNLVDITDMRQMAIKHPMSMSVNPIQIKEFIEEKQKEGKENIEIQKMIEDNFEEYFKV